MLSKFVILQLEYQKMQWVLLTFPHLCVFIENIAKIRKWMHAFIPDVYNSDALYGGMYSHANWKYKDMQNRIILPLLILF